MTAVPAFSSLVAEAQAKADQMQRIFMYAQAEHELGHVSAEDFASIQSQLNDGHLLSAEVTLVDALSAHYFQQQKGRGCVANG
jgi:hypothetical protein